MKRVKKATTKKQKFGRFAKLSTLELIRLRGGEDPPIGDPTDPKSGS